MDALLAANLRSVMLGCKVVGKEMARRRAGGCIINVSSLLAHRPAVGTAVYAAAKAGQLGEFLGTVLSCEADGMWFVWRCSCPDMLPAFTTSLAQEFAPYDIRVNAIVPGYIESKMTGGELVISFSLEVPSCAVVMTVETMRPPLHPYNAQR